MLTVSERQDLEQQAQAIAAGATALAGQVANPNVPPISLVSAALTLAEQALRLAVTTAGDVGA